MRVKGDLLKQLHRHDASIEIKRLEEELEKLHENLDEAIEERNRDHIDWYREQILIAANDIDGLRVGTYRAHVEPHDEADRWDRKEDSILHWQRQQEIAAKRIKQKLRRHA